MEIITSKHLNTSIEQYNSLMEVLNKPKRDLVPIAVVELIKNSICGFLSAFLHENGVENIDREDILALQQASAAINKSFLDLNYESIAALMEDDNFAYSSELDEDPLNRYLNTLDKTKDLVIRSVNHG